MKKAISISICTLILSLLAVRIVQISNDDIIKFGNLEKSYAVTFSIPDNNTICDPDTLFAILSRTAQDSKSNIIRTSKTDGKNRKSYVFNKYGDREIFRDFNLAVNSGEMLCVSGQSGSGKSTLFNIIGMFEQKVKNPEIS